MVKNVSRLIVKRPLQSGVTRDIFIQSESGFSFCSNFLKCLSDKSTELWGGEPEPEEEMVKRIGEVADGVFQVSELHETGGEAFRYVTMSV